MKKAKIKAGPIGNSKYGEIWSKIEVMDIGRQNVCNKFEIISMELKVR